LALGTERAVVEVANVIGVADFVVLNGSTPAFAVVATVLNPYGPALAVALGKVFAVFVIVVNVLTGNIPSACIFAQPTTISLMQ